MSNSDTSRSSNGQARARMRISPHNAVLLDGHVIGHPLPCRVDAGLVWWWLSTALERIELEAMLKTSRSCLRLARAERGLRVEVLEKIVKRLEGLVEDGRP